MGRASEDVMKARLDTLPSLDKCLGRCHDRLNCCSTLSKLFPTIIKQIIVPCYQK